MSTRWDGARIRRAHRPLALLAAVFLAAILCPAICEAADCDPQSALNDQARTFRQARRFDDAERIVQQILRSQPSDYRANYTEALIQLNRAGTDPRLKTAGIGKLIAVSLALPAQDRDCAKAKNFYSIYMVIGVEFYYLGDLSNAKKYFLLADANRDLLDADTRVNLLDNLGLVQMRAEHNTGCAAVYFRNAVSAGSRKAASHLQLAQNILSATGEREGCNTGPAARAP